MKKTLEIIFKDVYGGDGITRIEEVTTPKMERKKTTTRKREDIGVSVESSMDETMTEIAKTDIQTFKFEDGKPLLRLGGAHGKFWGALSEARKVLYALGNSKFKSIALINSIQVEPILVPLEPLAEMTVKILPQKLQGSFGGMIFPQFDVLPQCKCCITLSYPDAMEAIVEGLLAQVKSMSLFNKRRATIESMREIDLV